MNNYYVKHTSSSEGLFDFWVALKCVDSLIDIVCMDGVYVMKLVQDHALIGEDLVEVRVS